MMDLPAHYPSLEWHERRAVRNAYVQRQDGCCEYCKAPLDREPPKSISSKRIDWRRFPPNFLRHPVHLHHCHDTGMTVGAVHAYCNAVLWQYHGE